MSDSHDTATSAYDHAARDALGALTHEFVRTWQAGGEPSIDEFLARANGCDQDELTRRLVSIDLAFRCKNGEEISRSDYQSRYPCISGSEHETVVYPEGRVEAEQREARDSPPSGSRQRAAENLLFGMLGWQLHFIRRADLVRATQQWTSDKSRSLAEILIAEKKLSEDDAALIWVLVHKHVESHGGSLHRSLSVVGSDPNLRQELSSLKDGDVNSSLDELGGGDRLSQDGTQRRHTAEGTQSSSVRYVPLRPHARGGLGEVYVAYDSEVGREVALKEIQRRFADDYTSRTRFVLEGEITGGLEHPGIVPIYGLGVYPDGRPYYAMQLIRGVSLKQAVERFHKQEFAHRDDWTFELRRLLERFKSVCYTIEYAHSRGVLHRDLKPSNIMLGRYGETLVIDWGLAKALGHRDAGMMADEPTLRPSSGHGTPETIIGSAIGTPAYMSPEQARGRLDEIGFASDIFCLGATLYTILTDLAPYSGKLSEKLEQARTGDFPAPRKLNARVPRALEAVCLKAMALSPEMRYATCHDLAIDIERWLAGEPVSAFREPVLTRGARWMRRHRTQVLSVSLTGVLIAMIAGGWYWRESVRLHHLESDVSAIVAKAEDLIRDDNLAGAQLSLTGVLGRLNGEPWLASLENEVKARLDDVQSRLDTRAARTLAQDRFLQFQQLRDDALFHGTLLPGTDIEDHLDSTLLATRQALALYGVELPDSHGPNYDTTYYSAQLRQEIEHNCQELVLIHASAVARSQMGATIEEHHAAVEQAIAIIEATKPWAPETRARHLRMAACLALLGRTTEADVELELARQCDPTTAVDFFLVGNSLFDHGDFDSAFDSFSGALRVEPHHFWAQYFAAVCLLELDRPAEAVAHLTAAEGIREFVWIPILRGYAYGRLGEFDRAEEDFREAFSINPQEYGIFVNRGAMRIESGRLDEAVADLKRAIELKPHQFQAHINLGEAYRRQGQLDLALVFLNQAVELAPDAPKPYRVRAQVHLANDDIALALQDCDSALEREAADSLALPGVHFERAKILMRENRDAEALAALDACLLTDPDYADAHRLRGELLLSLSRGGEALESFSEYIRLGDPKADVLQKRAFERAKQGEFAGAIADYTAAIELDPKSPLALARRGWTYVNQAFEIALADFDEAIRLDPGNGDLYCGRGFARVKLGQLAKAVQDAEKALECGVPETSPNAQFALNYNAACIYAQAAGLVHYNVEETDIHETAARYVARSVELLASAVAQLPEANRATTGVTLLRSDDALAPIRSSTAFQTILADLEAEL